MEKKEILETMAKQNVDERENKVLVEGFRLGTLVLYFLCVILLIVDLVLGNSKNLPLILMITSSVDVAKQIYCVIKLKKKQYFLFSVLATCLFITATIFYIIGIANG